MHLPAHLQVAFSAVPQARERRPAPRVKVLPPSAFSDAWANRPFSPTGVGIRLVGEKTIESAISWGRGRARQIFEGLTPPFSADEDQSIRDAYNSALMQAVLADALCQPDDVDAPFFDEMARVQIAVAFRPLTLLALWEEYEQLSVSTSPASPAANAEELRDLVELLLEQASRLEGAASDVAEVSPLRSLRLARLLLGEMRGA